MRVLVTRPLRDAEATARRLMARGHEAVIAPVLDIVATDDIADDGAVVGTGAGYGHGYGPRSLIEPSITTPP